MTADRIFSGDFSVKNKNWQLLLFRIVFDCPPCTLYRHPHVQLISDIGPIIEVYFYKRS